MSCSNCVRADAKSIYEAFVNVGVTACRLPVRISASVLSFNRVSMSKKVIRIANVLCGLLLSICLTFGGKLVASAQVTPSTPDPYVGLSIPELAARSYGGGQLVVDQMQARGAGFIRYIVHYPSDGLTMYGFMDVPTAAPRNNTGYPVIIAMHGYIDPASYQTLDYTTHYADALARSGYLVIHPNLRGYRPSDSGPNLLRVGFAVDILNLIAIVRAEGGQAGPLQLVNPAAIGLWGHSMGGGIATRVMVVDQRIRAVVLYSAMSGDDKQNFAAIRGWTNGQRGQDEANIPDDVYSRVSPMYFYDRIQAAVSINHGLADQLVPPAWSANLCVKLQALKKSVDCFTYAGQPHTFTAAGDQVFIPRMIAFFDAHLRSN